MRRIAGALISLVSAGLGIFAIAPTSGARAAISSGVDDFEFQSFDAQYYLSRDKDGLASMKVVETIVALFPATDQNRGILRDIPRYYQDNPLNTQIISVTDELEHPVHYEESTVSSGDGNAYSFTELALGTNDFVHGPTTYVITYELHNVIGHFADAKVDELYWDVNGTGWAQRFGTVSATIHVDPAIAAKSTGDVACFWGYYDETNTCDLTADNDGKYSTTVEDVHPYSTVTFVIDFGENTFVQPALAKNSWIITTAPWALVLVAVLMVLFALIVRFVVWRDARGRGIIVPQYSGPTDNDLLLSGDLVRRENTALSAQFVGLAVRGFVNVVDLKPDSGGLSGTGPSRARLALEYVKSDGSSTQEARVLGALFGSDATAGRRVELGSLSPTKGAALFAMRAKARQRVISGGLRAQPAGKIDRYLRRSTWLVILSYPAIFIWTIFTGVDSAPVFGFGTLALILCITAAGVISKPYLLTAPGADQRDYLRGIRDYLALAEEDRIRVLQSPEGAERIDVTDKRAVVHLNESLLPYAVLFGVEREWSRELAVEFEAVSEAPTWLNGTFRSTNFGSMVSLFSTTSTSSVRPIAQPSSSGSSWSSSGGSSFSSGFGGGGFSGGGGGGGGGGGR